ncbi:MAG: HDOD domain-containing protein [Bacteroidetes bacterium]|nr:HDOD domain-containing protein [Bacteroidota bacterium]
MNPEGLVQRFKASASPPIIYLRLNEEINHPDTSLARVGRIISEDASLTARLLRLVNSPFYGFPHRIGSIHEAVFLVGSRQVRDLALVTTLMATFGTIPRDLIDTQSFWLHSLACGTASRLIARSMGKQEGERFFLLGVMHDIGRIVMFNTEPIMSESILRRAAAENRSLTELEHEVFGFTHTQVGRVLTEQWKLPVFLNEVVRCHHAPERAVSFPEEAAIVHAADILAHAVQLGASGEPLLPVLHRPSWERLMVPVSSVERLMREIHTETTAMAWLSSEELTGA